MHKKIDSAKKLIVLEEVRGAQEYQNCSKKFEMLEKFDNTQAISEIVINF